jgi:hypothetical protein
MIAISRTRADTEAMSDAHEHRQKQAAVLAQDYEQYQAAGGGRGLVQAPHRTRCKRDADQQQRVFPSRPLRPADPRPPCSSRSSASATIQSFERSCRAVFGLHRRQEMTALQVATGWVEEILIAAHAEEPPFRVDRARGVRRLDIVASHGTIPCGLSGSSGFGVSGGGRKDG